MSLPTPIEAVWASPPRAVAPAPTRRQIKLARREARSAASLAETGRRARIDDMIAYCARCGTPDAVIAANIRGLYES